MSTKDEIGRRLKIARERSGMTLQEVCDKVPALNGNPSKLNNYEKGRRYPDLDMLKAIAKVLSTDAAWLATLVDQEPDRRTSLLVRYYQGSDERGKDSILRTAEIQSRYEPDVNGEDYPPESLCG
jgi:transcriptional regulator with XRE-family HTH domain